jgi:hypothetical protein
VGKLCRTGNEAESRRPEATDRDKRPLSRRQFIYGAGGTLALALAGLAGHSMPRGRLSFPRSGPTGQTNGTG